MNPIHGKTFLSESWINELESAKSFSEDHLQDVCMNNLESLADSTVRIDVTLGASRGNGSGVIVDERGTIVTCEHVVRPEGRSPDEISVLSANNKSWRPEILNLDPTHDLAVLRVPELAGRKPVSPCDQTNVGDECWIFGFPLRLPHLTIAHGTISARGQNLIPRLSFNLLQIDASINRGNSGGPVFTRDGQLVGIVSMKYIPYLDQIDELGTFVRNIPVAASNGIGFGSISWGAYFNFVNDSLKRISDALMIVQVGIGWAIPVNYLVELVES